MKKYFLPTDDTGKALWLSNFASKLAGYAAKYSLAAAEVSDMVASELYFIFWVQMRLNFEEFKKKLTSYKNEMRDGMEPGSTPSIEPVLPAFGPRPPAVAPGIFVRATAIANRIKSHHNYNDADGQDLGIEGPEFSLDLNSLKPQLSIELATGRPVISYTKLGLTGLEIHVKRSDGQFEFLAFEFSDSYKDMFTLPAPGQTAIWKYKAVYRLKGEQVGQWSDEVSVVVGG